MSRVRIKFKNQEYLVEAEGGNLLDHIRKAGIPIGAPCGGKGTCKKCTVKLSDSDKGNESKTVLACEIEVGGDMSVEVPSPSEARILSEAYWPEIDLKWDKAKAEQEYGVGIDIGTTTVVVFLEDLNKHKNISNYSFLNPQSSYGADIVSRIQAVMQDGELLREQKNLILRGISDAITQQITEKGIRNEQISKISIAGNAPMLHILMGSDPSGLAIYPFTPVFLDEQQMKGSELGLELYNESEVSLLPSLSAYVGADIIAGLAATELSDDEGYSLYLDIGTNGEMALGNKDRILTCATAAGPAFEGANISCGLGGVDGAIHSFDENGFKTIGSAPASGLCGSGLVDVIAWLLNQDKLDPSGYLEEAVEILDGGKTADGLPLQLTPQDIREVQLAKGAIAAGIKTLLSEANIDASQVERLYLAGGFGYALHEDSAARIGLIPENLKSKIIRAGNLAGLGARLALHSEEFKVRVDKIRDKAEYFELSNHMGFNEAFVMEMGF